MAVSSSSPRAAKSRAVQERARRRADDRAATAGGRAGGRRRASRRGAAGTAYGEAGVHFAFSLQLRATLVHNFRASDPRSTRRPPPPTRLQARELEIKVQTVKLMQEEIKFCYRKNGVNHYQACKEVTSKYMAYIRVRSNDDRNRGATPQGRRRRGESTARLERRLLRPSACFPPSPPAATPPSGPCTLELTLARPRSAYTIRVRPFAYPHPRPTGSVL